MRVVGLAYLRHSVLLELAVGAAILVFTSILVNTEPANEAVDRTVHRSLSAAGLHVDVTIAPGRVGTDSITLVATDGAGRPQPIQEASGSLALSAHGISSLPVTFTTAKGSDQATTSTAFAESGNWQLTFEVQLSPINATQFTTNFRVH